MSDVNDRAEQGSDEQGSDEQRSDEEASPEVAAIAADIERTREELAQTVDQLAAKLDVKSRVRDRVSEAKEQAAAQVRVLRDRATDERGRPTPAAVTVAGGVVAGVAAVVLVSLWRRSMSRGPSRKRRRR